MSANSIPGRMPLLRQCSGTEQVECFCLEPVGQDPSSDIRLACRCLVHKTCIINYLRVQWEDKSSLLADMERSKACGVICPYARANACSAVGSDRFISIADMQELINPWDGKVKSPLPADSLAPFEIARLKQWIEDETAPRSEKNEVQEDFSQPFILATTKKCPTCQFRVTHWHGHSCHHIQPGGGCPSCRVGFCYKCLSSAKQNQSARGAAHLCKCGGWSNFCHRENIIENLTLMPFPQDKVCVDQCTWTRCFFMCAANCLQIL
jgi:hypothetical protein